MGEEEKILLARIDERLAAHVDSQDTWQDGTTVKINHIERCVQKDNVRIDRIEQKEKSRAKLLWLAIGTAVASLGSWISTHWR